MPNKARTDLVERLRPCVYNAHRCLLQRWPANVTFAYADVTLSLPSPVMLLCFCLYFCMFRVDGIYVECGNSSLVTSIGSNGQRCTL